MTPEQLDEIENRQAAAMWIGGPTAAFAQDTLLLVKALREARAEMDEFALAVGYGERPEGQSGVHRLHGEQLADRWKQIERELDEARAEVERLRGLLKTVWEDACDQEAGFLDEVCDAVEAALKEGEP